MKSIKKLLFTAMFIGLIVALAACGSESGDDSSSESTSGDGASDTEEQVTITYARSNDVTPSTEKLIEKFEETHPNITIELREMPSSTSESHDQYVTIFSSQSSEIDVFDADVVWTAEFAQADYVMELDRFIEESEVNMDEYFPGPVDAVTYNNRIWAMPKFSDAGLLYYRTDLVENAPETWDDMIAMAEEAAGKEGTEFGFAMQANQYEGLVVNALEYISAYGGQILDENGEVVIDSPESVKGLEKMVEIAQSDITPNNVLNFSETETETAFLEGKTVFARNWPYMSNTAEDEERSKVAGNVGYAVLPAGDDGSASTLGGWTAMISRYSEHPAEAWEFLQFMTGEEGQIISAVEGARAPTLEALYDLDEVKEAAPLFAMEEFVASLQNAVSRPVSPIYPELSDIMQIELSKALAGEITAEEAVQNMQAKMTAATNE
ncbi:extracellular solute-binding protein [Oceanobacillus halophilus]|uniref:Extracellular solute-binding protein n=1 Tax=Oceanobacillus halophilus TaxID=930130 RepID=A0A494ZZT3_9BACI|nr:extracellular solute-binding protein [Oceanobacillus halophilus]RKQ32509.1 extracellular solute-binding protein [Oceanobacillus halophilus]